MPTGYTAQIKDGISFNEFVMSCARAMGALIMMREEPANAPIPERFEPSSYHADKITETKNDLARYESMADSEAAREAESEYANLCVAREKKIQDAHDLRAKYLDMLVQVERWTPPTAAHLEFKKFMIEQITSSINFDCCTKYNEQPRKLSAGEWRAAKIAEAYCDLTYHSEAHHDEVKRVEQRNEWLRQLRLSLAKCP